ncbi:MAG: ATP-dependent helicase HrpB [Nitrospirae bacterium]|nr:ATP-dependent helicase HrpB [Nitrospirota bacterium]
MNKYPIDEAIPRLIEALKTHSSVVLAAPPGAGKTTRVPVALLDMIAPEQGRIVMLEPRRIAASTCARWMAKSLGEAVGETVGYTIRFDSRVSQKTRIEVVTEGILTRRIQNDPALEGVAMVIFDEFHERSIHADLALALCMDARAHLRDDLKLLVMSATLDIAPIAALLGDAPIVKSEGKAFPVVEKHVVSDSNKRLPENVAIAVSHALRKDEGDILVFLPGAGEIRACAELIKLPTAAGGSSGPTAEAGGVSVHPLYGDMPFEEQERAILPGKTRRIVLATNIAETSLTIEGVRVVIDSGLARTLRHDPSTGMNRLVTVSISQASARQRAGRAGRLEPGVCYRLYAEHEFRAMLPFTPPEILVSDLSGLVLELAVWGVKSPGSLSWLDQPPAAQWEAGKSLLVDLGALDRNGNVTALGREMAQIPAHPRLARLLMRAGELGCAALGADIAALLSERDIFKGQQIGQHTGRRDPDIELRLDSLRAWRKGSMSAGDGSAMRSASLADSSAMRSVDRVSKQFQRLSREDSKKSHADDLASRLLLRAFPDRIAKRRMDGNGKFVTARGRGVRVPETCALAQSPYIVAAELDAGVQAEGTVYLAAPVSEAAIRDECAGIIETVRRVEWDARTERISGAIEERIGALALSVKAFNPSDDEAAPILIDTIAANFAMLRFSEEARRFQARVGFVRRAYPEEEWPDMSDERLAATLPQWLAPWLGGARSARAVAGIDVLSALKAMLDYERMRLLDERAPTHIGAPSGRRVAVDYSGEHPVLAVKLQEMFGLADSPAVCGGRAKLTIHLLSPAGRPLQITQDLRGFWNGSYQQVKKEMKGRYPKHPWPDDPWNAVATRRTKAGLERAGR